MDLCVIKTPVNNKSEHVLSLVCLRLIYIPQMFGPAVAKPLCCLVPAVKFIIILFMHTVSTVKHRFNDFKFENHLRFTFINVQQIKDYAATVSSRGRQCVTVSLLLCVCETWFQRSCLKILMVVLKGCRILKHIMKYSRCNFMCGV